MTRDKLQITFGDLGVVRTAWEKALKSAVPDPVVQIRHAAISGNEQNRLHVAAIPDRVGCHFHAHGDEAYAIVSGRGTLYWGKVAEAGNGYNVISEDPVDVAEGESFIIPEGYAHQLKNTGTDDLVIVFACPDSHLNDKADRTILPPLAP